MSGQLDLLRYGDRAWLIGGCADPLVLADWLQGLAWSSPVEPVAGAETCLLRFSGPAPSHADMAAVLADAPDQLGSDSTESEVVTIEVSYDGPDLDDVAERSGLSAAEVIALHSGTTFRVAFLGFAPGFGYLSGLPDALHLPRRSAPRIRVPAGAVAIADRYSAVYPRSSPGGWHLLGTTSQWLFDPQRTPPSRLRAGALVRFEAVA